jgi:hypothetical protein
VDKEFVGVELSPSGCELMALLTNGKPVQTVHGDFLAAHPVDMDLPKGSLIFTSHAAYYLEERVEDFFINLCQLRPGAVAHFEPLYEHYPPDGLLGLMQRRYMDVNGYNRHLLPALYRLEQKGKIRILVEKKGLFAINPFLASSFVLWEPV